MQIPKPERIRDKAYRDSARDRYCQACFYARRPDDETTVLAHINIVGNFGRGLKAGDDESVFLCARHHQEFDTDPNRCEWLVRNILLPQRKAAYRRWKVER